MPTQDYKCFNCQCLFTFSYDGYDYCPPIECPNCKALNTVKESLLYKVIIKND